MSASARLLAAPRPGAALVTCADIGSTFTKLSVVDTGTGTLVATAGHPTTVDTDVLDGVDAARAAVADLLSGAELGTLRACSSAGGGLRLAVIGYEQLVSGEAGHRVALSAGARVVHVSAGRLDRAGVAALRADRPDVVLLVGGTDGGDAAVLAHNAGRLARARWRRPVVLAGNAAVREELTATLSGHGVPVVACENVLPRIGVLNPGPARSAIRQVFLRHVIGGKRLSRGPRLASLVRGATPDVVLTAVELLGEDLGGDLAVVDVGGATTDVYSVLVPDAERESGPNREVAGTLWHGRTVEGDLGMRWNAPGVLAAARAERLSGEDTALDAAAAVRAGTPGMLAGDDAARAVDLRIATLAATVALRRHARGEALIAGAPRRGGKDLRAVRMVVGSGGVLRYAPAEAAVGVLAAAVADREGGWPLPRAPRLVVDSDYVLAPAGLLAEDHREAALDLMRRHLRGPGG